MTTLYLTTSIPYVNGAPHLGHALELVHVDALARHRRARGGTVRVQSGTDDHALKNVSAAARAGVPVAELVAVNGDRFAALAAALGVRTDEFVRTSRDARHAPGVVALWDACRAAGDLYRTDYTGWYCAGCEQFYALDELIDGVCAEHQAPVEQVTETNWFFRLSRYRERIIELLTSGQVVITPSQRRNEVLGFLAGDVRDVSVSRPAARADGWGIRVPGDPDQVVYVWFDALANYLTGLGFGGDDQEYQRWWASDTERVHVIGKGILRFHAVYWLGFLLSAGLPLPTRILVHDYLTIAGAKIAKSGTRGADPGELVARYGVDAVRWWLLRDPAPVGTTDYTDDRLIACHDRELANSLGNLVVRALTLSRRRHAWQPGPVPGVAEAINQAATAYRAAGVGAELRHAADALPATVDAALCQYDLRAACQAVAALADAGNRFIDREAPWLLATAADAGDLTAAARFEAVIDAILDLCRVAANELAAFVPDGAARLLDQLDAPTSTLTPVFPRIRRPGDAARSGPAPRT